jgi:hypothetical protein
MKSCRKVLFSAMLLASALLARGQCGQDSTVDHTPITVGMDSVAPPCYPFDCTTHDSCHYVTMMDSFSGVFELSNVDEMFEIVILDRCRWVVFDTCTLVASTTPGFVLFNRFPPESTVMICGDGLSSILVTTKHVPSANFPPFGLAVLDIDTLCGPFTSLDPVSPIDQKEIILQFDGVMWRHVAQVPCNAMIKRKKI